MADVVEKVEYEVE